jgi:hypothetical protein
MVFLLFAGSPSAGPILVEEASCAWEPGLTETGSPDIDPRIIGEYTSIMLTVPLIQSDADVEAVGPRFVVEYATTIARVGLNAIAVCQADIFKDGRVDDADVGLLALDFGRSDCDGDCAADLSSDGDVDGADLAVMAAEFGNYNCPLMD